MASSPAFAATPNISSNVLSATADSSYTAPTHSVTVFTAGSSGSVINVVDFVGAGTTVAGVVQLYLYDGSTYHAWISQLVTAVTPSTTQVPFYASQTFNSRFIKSAWSLVATSFVASQLVNVIAFGEDL